MHSGGVGDGVQEVKCVPDDWIVGTSFSRLNKKGQGLRC